MLYPQGMFSKPLTMLACSCQFPLQPRPFRSREGESRAWPSPSPGEPPLPSPSHLHPVSGRWGGSHVNPVSSWAFLRTSSKEAPAGTEMRCLYGCKAWGTFSMTLMSSWVCEGVSTAGCNRTMPGREEGVAGVRAGGQVLVLLSSLKDTVAHFSQHHR